MDVILFFTNVGPNLAKQLLFLKRMYLCFIIWEENLIKDNMFLSPVDDQYIIRTVKMLRSKCQQIVTI